MTLTEDADELGHAGRQVLEVHVQTAVPVAASEGLGQLVVQVEARGRPPLSLGCPGSPTSGSYHPSDFPGKADTRGAWSHLSSPSSASSQP